MLIVIAPQMIIGYKQHKADRGKIKLQIDDSVLDHDNEEYILSRLRDVTFVHKSFALEDSNSEVNSDVSCCDSECTNVININQMNTRNDVIRDSYITVCCVETEKVYMGTPALTWLTFMVVSQCGPFCDDCILRHAAHEQEIHDFINKCCLRLEEENNVFFTTTKGITREWTQHMNTRNEIYAGLKPAKR